ncbi:thioredoxin-like protein [Thermanaerovibrio velox DSM 12556]|uniref:Thioredoxin-like protein n=1 Tax=Thermanaerovibrio velox DSM 12556 TaxID=926567 RepID=H0URC4_9BACT|nr:thioredoxin-like protein [Thermanaerovibrio velox DSM 12556]
MLMEEGIKKLIDQEIRPALQSHGGDIEFLGFDEASKVVRVSLTGACGTCPFAQETLRVQVEQVIKRSFPDVAAVKREG